MDKNAIPQFPHPPISPDVSLIKPIWFDWKNNFQAGPTVPETVEVLKRAVIETWDKVTIKQINVQIASIMNRRDVVIFAEGGNTGY